MRKMLWVAHVIQLLVCSARTTFVNGNPYEHYKAYQSAATLKAKKIRRGKSRRKGKRFFTYFVRMCLVCWGFEARDGIRLISFPRVDTFLRPILYIFTPKKLFVSTHNILFLSS